MKVHRDLLRAWGYVRYVAGGKTGRYLDGKRAMEGRLAGESPIFRTAEIFCLLPFVFNTLVAAADSSVLLHELQLLVY